MAYALPRSTERPPAQLEERGAVRATFPPTPVLQLMSDVLHMPFDLMRSQHAQAIHAGLMANSILESRDFEHRVDALEHICLGPFARHV